MKGLNRWWRYLWFRVCHPRLRDFVDEGLGIEARFERCKSHWREHLELTKLFVSNSLQEGEVPLRHAQFLGAGRCYDIDVGAVAACLERITLVDADPSAASYVRRHIFRSLEPRVTSRIHYLVKDLTGGLESWEAVVDTLARKQRHLGLEAFWVSLRSVTEWPPLPQIPLEGEMVVSLNLLSQIPLMWQEQVARVIMRVFGESITKHENFAEHLWSSLAPARFLLEQHHLQTLGNSNAQCVVVITDVWWHLYEQASGHWETDAALTPATQALFLREGPSRTLLSGYERRVRDSWWWHLVPQGIESPDYGAIHDVVAIELRATARERGEET